MRSTDESRAVHALHNPRMNNAWPYLLAVLAVGGLPLLVALYWHGQWRRLQDSVNVERRQAQEVFDTLDIGLLVFDADNAEVARYPLSDFIALG